MLEAQQQEHHAQEQLPLQEVNEVPNESHPPAVTDEEWVSEQMRRARADGWRTALLREGWRLTDAGQPVHVTLDADDHATDMRDLLAHEELLDEEQHAFYTEVHSALHLARANIAYAHQRQKQSKLQHRQHRHNTLESTSLQQHPLPHDLQRELSVQHPPGSTAQHLQLLQQPGSSAQHASLHTPSASSAEHSHQFYQPTLRQGHGKARVQYQRTEQRLPDEQHALQSDAQHQSRQLPEVSHQPRTHHINDMQGNDATEHAQERLPQQVPQLLHEARTNNSHAMHYAAMQNTEHLMTGALTIPLFRLGRRLPCSHCGALLFVHENNWGHMCCLKGQVQLQPILEVVPLPQDAPRDTMLKAAAVKSICDMWRSTNQEGNTLRKYARQLNNALAMASATAASEVTPRGGAWKPSVIVCGKVYTKMGPLINSAPNSTRKFAQSWFHDPQHDVEDATIDTRLQHMRLPAHIPSSERDTLRLIFSKFQQWLRQCNPFVQDFQMA